MDIKNIKHKINTLPEKPGVYIFKDENGEIIYIGKAKVLKNRVKSYFQKSKMDIKTDRLSKKIYEFDCIVTNNEMEAFLLEGTLIKQHKPYYNVLLKDDKSFPYIKITKKEKYPGIYFTRNTKDKKAVYYGPYFAEDAKKVLELIYKIFKVRQCNYNFDVKPLQRPCVFYDAGLCSAPCVRFVTEHQYQNSVKESEKFLNGSYKNILEKLKKEMSVFSQKRQYEDAAEIRDSIKAVQNVMQKQVVVLREKKNVDVIYCKYMDHNFYFCVLNVRSGRLVSKKTDVFNDVMNEDGVFEAYLMQYYNRNISYPDEIILPDGLLNRKIIFEFFKRKDILVKFKKRHKLLEMANENIKQKVMQNIKRAEEQKVKIEKMQFQLMELQKILHLKKFPEIIDAIDVSHFSGENIVASCVVFRNGVPDYKSYRRYKIKNADKINDCSAIYEVVMRRYGRIIQEKKKMADLILIDGGVAQVNAAKHGMNMVGIQDINIIGLAKKKEEVYLPENSKPFDMPEKSKLILQKIRDEAHRFAVSYQALLSNKKLKKTIFDDIPFIGEKTKYNIYSQFKNRNDLIYAIEKNDNCADFLTAKQKHEILKKLKDEKNEI